MRFSPQLSRLQNLTVPVSSVTPYGSCFPVPSPALLLILKQLNILVVRGPKLNTVLEMQSRQCQMPAGYPQWLNGSLTKTFPFFMPYLVVHVGLSVCSVGRAMSTRSWQSPPGPAELPLVGTAMWGAVSLITLSEKLLQKCFSKKSWDQVLER